MNVCDFDGTLNFSHQQRAIVEDHTFRSMQDVPLYQKRSRQRCKPLEAFDDIDAIVVWQEVESDQHESTFDAVSSAFMDLSSKRDSTTDNLSIQCLPTQALAHGTVILSNYLYNFDFMRKYDTFNRLSIRENLHEWLGNVGVALVDVNQPINIKVTGKEKNRILWLFTHTVDPQQLTFNPSCNFPCYFLIDSTMFEHHEEGALRVINCDTRKLQNTEGKNPWIDPLWDLWEKLAIPKLYLIHSPTTLSFHDYYEIIPNKKTKDIVCGSMTRSTSECTNYDNSPTLPSKSKWAFAFFQKDLNFAENEGTRYIGYKELPKPANDEVAHFQLLKLHITNQTKEFTVDILNLAPTVSNLPNPNQVHFHWSDIFTKKNFLITFVIFGGVVVIVYIANTLFPIQL
jgi:hypothetical protein